MRTIYLQYFAAIFAVFVLIEPTYAGLHYAIPVVNKNKDGMENDDQYSPKYPLVKLPSNDLISLDHKTYTGYSDKRSLTAVLIGVGAISAAADIYKQEAGCTHFAPELNPNYVKIGEYHDEILATTAKINLDWVPITEAENYFDLLASNLEIVRQFIAKLDILKLDILTLLDISIRTNLDLTTTQVENEILANNVTDYNDPDYLVAKYFSKAGYAVSLSLKLIPVAGWLGAKFFATSLGKSISAYFAKKFVSDNPGYLVRVIQNLKERGLFPNTRLRWNNWLANSPRYQAFKAKLALGPKTKAFWQAHKTKLQIFGKTAVAGLFLAYEAYLLWKLWSDCQEKLRESEKTLAELVETKQNLTWVQGNMTELSDAYQGNYTDMLSELQSWEFALLVEETRNMTILALNQTEDKIVAATNFSIFLNGINNTINVVNNVAVINYTYTGYLVDTLLYAFGATSSTLECYRRKLSVITTVTDDCADGKGTYDSLWTDAKNLEGQTLADCIVEDNYLSEAEVKEVIEGYMDTKGKRQKCVQNNALLQGTVCNYWKDITTTQTSILSDAAVTNAGADATDVAYFISQCGTLTLSDAYVTDICTQKKGNATVGTLTTKYVKYPSTAVTAAYDGCLFDADQNNTVCDMKNDLKTVDAVYPIFPYYAQSYVLSIFTECVVSLSDYDKSQICIKSPHAPNASHGLYVSEVAKTSLAQVQAVIDECLANAGDEPDNHEKLLEFLHHHADQRKTFYHHLKKESHLTRKDEKHRKLLVRLEDMMSDEIDRNH